MMRQSKILSDAEKPRWSVLILRDRLPIWMRAAEQYYDRHGLRIFCLLMAVFSTWAWVGSRARLLWLDEVLGLSAATAPQLQDVFSALARPVDINPPLYHLLARLSIASFGFSAFAARLPAFLGMLVFLLCLYIFISRRFSPCYGVLGALLVLSTYVPTFAWDARPYGVLLGLTGLAMVSYQRRAERKDIASFVVFSLVCFLLPLTHYYGTLVIGPFLVAEVARTIKQKEMDRPSVIVMLLAPSAALFLLRNLIGAQKLALSHYQAPGHLTSFVYGTEMFIPPAWTICIAIAALAFGVWVGTAAEESHLTRTHPEFSAPELVLAISLLSLPFLGAVVTLFTHAYVSRYFIAACAGYAVLICYLAACFRRRCPGVALLLSIAALLGIVQGIGQSFRDLHELQPLASLETRLGNSNLPVVFQDAKDYVVARELNPGMRNRIYYAAEPELALRVTDTNSDDLIMRAFASVQPEQVSRLNDMARKSESWIVVPAGFGWLVPCLARMQLDMRPISLGATPSQTVPFAFMVRLPQPGSKPVAWCEAPSSSAP